MSNTVPEKDVLPSFYVEPEDAKRAGSTTEEVVVANMFANASSATDKEHKVGPYMRQAPHRPVQAKDMRAVC